MKTTSIDCFMILRQIACAALVISFALGCARSEEDVVPKAIELIQQGKTDDAIKLLTQTLEKDTKNLALYKVRSRIYMRLNDHAKAAADLNQVAELGELAAYRHAGAEYFYAGNFAASLAAFDACAKHFPNQAPQLWERGITLYYLKRFADGRKQFEDHKAVNPHDVENAAWHFICAAKETSVEQARKALIFIDTDQDTRIPMKQVYLLFKGDGKPEDVLAAATAGNPGADALKNQLCYAHLYLGLYFEALGETKKAREHLEKSAVEFGEDHYMGQVGRVHWATIKDVK
ncbi:MAG: tetratricopeptide repeat protein [Planctomycetota bacterium]